MHFCRSEEGLDDDDDEDDDDVMQQQEANVPSRQSNDGFNPMLQVFNAITNMMAKSAMSAAQNTAAKIIGLDRNEALRANNGGDGDNDNVTERATGNYKALLTLMEVYRIRD